MTITVPVAADAEEREARRRARDAARKRVARARSRDGRQASRRIDRRRPSHVWVLLGCLAVVAAILGAVAAPRSDAATADRLAAVLAGLSEVEARMTDRVEAHAFVPAVSLAPATNPALAAMGEDSAAAAANSAAALSALGGLRRQAVATAETSTTLASAIDQLRTDVAELRTTVASASLVPPTAPAPLEPVPLVPSAPAPVEDPVLPEASASGAGGAPGPTYDFTVTAGESLVAVLERACAQADECDAVVLGTDAVWRAGVTQTVHLTWDQFLGQLVHGFPAARAQPWIVLHDNRVIELRDRT